MKKLFFILLLSVSCLIVACSGQSEKMSTATGKVTANDAESYVLSKISDDVLRGQARHAMESGRCAPDSVGSAMDFCNCVARSTALGILGAQQQELAQDCSNHFA